MNSLPNSSEVDASKLAGIFSDRTNSYKFLWLKAIFSTLQERNFESSTFSFEELVNQMMLFAWYPSHYYKLSFGYWDRLPRYLGSSDLDLDGSVNLKKVKKEIERMVTDDAIKHLSRYVPYRALTVWFKNELYQIEDDTKRHKLTVKLASELFDKTKPLYRIVDKSIEIHPDWVSYIRKNLAILNAWIDWNWAGYLQSKNSSVPNIANKINIGNSRKALTQLTKNWNEVIENSQVRCIYSNEILESGEFSLDHFVPWAYVAHNEPWNIVPVIKRPNVNSMKSNNLPSEEYVSKIIASQLELIQFNKKNYSGKKWSNFIAPYVEALKLQEDDMLNKNKLAPKLGSLILSQLEGAKRLGFVADWSYPARAE
jgi:hypothetical protein